MKKNQLLAIFSTFFIIILSSSLISVLSTNNNNVILKNKSERNVTKNSLTKVLTPEEIAQEKEPVYLFEDQNASNIYTWPIDFEKMGDWKTNNIVFGPDENAVPWYMALVLGMKMTTAGEYVKKYNQNSQYQYEWIINTKNFTAVTESNKANYNEGWITFQIKPTQEYIDSNKHLNFQLKSKDASTPLPLNIDTTLFIKIFNLATPSGLTLGGYIGLGVGIGLVSIIFGGIAIRTLVHKKRIYFSKNKTTKEIVEIEEIVEISEKDESKKIDKTKDKLDKK